MSLIYEALKQSERRVSVAPVIALRAFPAARTATARRRAIVTNKTIGLAVAVVVLGLTSSYFLQTAFWRNASWFAAKATPTLGLAAVPQALSSVGDAVATANDPVATADVVRQLPLEDRPVALSLISLPRALQPLPTMPPALRMVERLSETPKSSTSSKAPLTSSESIDKAIKDSVGPRAPTATDVMAAAPVSTPTPVPSVTLLPSVAPIANSQASVPPPPPVATSPEDVSVLFQKMNQALATDDKVEAQRQLRSIQGTLREGSIARLRAEAWFAHQTGNLSVASRTYRLLLEKLPGDELSAINLVAIERQQNQPNEAREVVKRALRYNTNSAALRSASDQLSLGGATR